jgi:hypothetical protein
MAKDFARDANGRNIFLKAGLCFDELLFLACRQPQEKS